MMKEFWPLFLAALVGACGGGAGTDLAAETELMALEIDAEFGRATVRERQGTTVVLGLHQAVELVEGDERRLLTTSGRPLECRREEEQGVVSFACTCRLEEGLSSEAVFRLERAFPGRLRLETAFVTGGQAVKLRRVFPFRVSAEEGGGVLLGGHPAAVRVLMNGSDELADFFVDLYPGDRPLSDPEKNILLSGFSSYSNGNALAYDLEGGHSLLVGFLTCEWAIPLVAFAGDTAAVYPVAGRLPLSDLLGEARFPWTVEVPAGERLSAGAAVLILGADSPHQALEQYADALVGEHRVDLPELPLSGWDSWYTTVPARTDLDQTYVRAAADGLSAAFGEYGLSSMQLDEGWQDQWGDWNPRAGFTDGLAATADYIRLRGLLPELWIAPFSAVEGSRLYQQHPDWFMPKGLYGQILMPANMHALDLANPQALEYALELAERIASWGFGSVKMDFAYYNLLSELPPDWQNTPVALYRRAVRQFRERLGGGIHFINISQCFPNYGLVDAFRIGLDTWPCWEGGCDELGYPAGTGIMAQGVKPGARMSARRYWLNGRVWFNHQDQIFFRDLTLDEATAFLSMAGLSGGLVSLGEDVENLAPAEIDRYRRILPLSGRTARPLDLFERDVPELWYLPLADAGGGVLGLFHWGANRDLTQNPFVDLADGTELTHRVPLSRLGFSPGETLLAYEFWSDEYLGEFNGELSLVLSPHTVKVVRLLARPGRPAALSTNRHLLMGPGVLAAEAWNEDELRLSGRVRTTPGFEQTIAVWVPDGYQAVAGGVEGMSAVLESRQPQIAILRFTGADDGWHRWNMDFSR